MSERLFRFFTLEDLSLDLEPGQIMGFVGPNGAGKSTTIRLMTGLLAPDAGEVRVLGHAMPEGQALAKRDIGFVSDDMRLFGHATLGWHMKFVASIYPGWDEQYARTLVRRFNLRPEQNVSGLSSGEHVKAVMLLSLARRPRLLILDEPTSGLDPVARHELLTEFMDVLRDEDRSILSLRTIPPTWSVFPIASRSSIAAAWSTAATRRISSTAGAASSCSFPRAQRCRTCRTSSAASSMDNLSRSLPTDTQRISSNSWCRRARVQRMSLEEIFVANVMHHREARGE